LIGQHAQPPFHATRDFLQIITLGIHPLDKRDQLSGGLHPVRIEQGFQHHAAEIQTRRTPLVGIGEYLLRSAPGIHAGHRQGRHDLDLHEFRGAHAPLPLLNARNRGRSRVPVPRPYLRKQPRKKNRPQIMAVLAHELFDGREKIIPSGFRDVLRPDGQFARIRPEPEEAVLERGAGVFFTAGQQVLHHAESRVGGVGRTDFTQLIEARLHVIVAPGAAVDTRSAGQHGLGLRFQFPPAVGDFDRPRHISGGQCDRQLHLKPRVAVFFV